MWLKKKNISPEFPPVKLYGKRTLVRPPSETDWPAWLDIRTKNKQALTPFEPTWPRNSLSEEFFTKMFYKQINDWGADYRYAFLIYNIDDTQLLGGVNINNVQRGVLQSASFGYWLDKDQQGNGYMSDALTSLIAFSFTTLDLHRLQIACMPHNEKSINIAKRLNFTDEGFAKRYIKINGKWEDHQLFGLTIEDWQRRHQHNDPHDIV